MLAFALIGAEIGIGAALLWRPQTLWPLGALVFAVFLGYQIDQFRAGIEDCTCLGAVSPSTTIMMVVDALCLGLFVGIGLYRQPAMRESWARMAIVGVAVVIVAIIALSLPVLGLRTTGGHAVAAQLDESFRLPMGPPYDILIVRSGCPVCEKVVGALALVHGQSDHRVVIDLDDPPQTGPWAEFVTTLETPVAVPQLIAVRYGRIVDVVDWSQKAKGGR